MITQSRFGQKGDRTILKSPTYTLTTPTKLSFSYHMRMPSRDYDARFQVILSSHLGLPLTEIFNAVGNKGSNWIRESACLPAGTYKVLFIGTQGKTFESDIGLDDISLRDGCASPITIAPTGKHLYLTYISSYPIRT